MQIVSGRSCVRGLNYGAVIIDDVKLVSPPQSGQVTLTGPGFSYTAKPNFQGQDAFTLQVSGSMVRIRGSSEIKVLVTVGENKTP
jgi:Bacterial Ig domain